VIDKPVWRRLFVGVPLPEHACAAVADLVDVVRASEPERSHLRWVRMDGLHLTIRFLGPTQPDRVPAIGAALAMLAGTIAPFEVVLAGGGAFPSAARPRALWLAVGVGSAGLIALADGVSRALVPLGWPLEERPFRPHLTLARADGVAAGPATAARLTSAAADLEVRFTAAEIVLMESHTGRGPARYESVLTAPLAGEASGP